MRNGYVLKSAACGQPTEDDMKLINTYTRRELKNEEVYVFSVVLCDNDIDRDFDCFTKEALEGLAKLYVGKTGILNHDVKAENQTARIISCAVEEVPGKQNMLKNPYYRLVAKAYMPRSDKNKDFILEIDSGIKKEVSVSCSMKKISCSVCGADWKVSSCDHKKGKTYDSTLCYALLEQPLDAYEWSFVAVPAQREAGIIKTFSPEDKGGVLDMQEILKKFESNQSITLSPAQVEKLAAFIKELEIQAKAGKLFKDDLQKEVIRLCAIAQPNLSAETIGSVAEKMSIEELKEFKKSFSEKVNSTLTPKPQLVSEIKLKNTSLNTEFKI